MTHEEVYGKKENESLHKDHWNKVTRTTPDMRYLYGYRMTMVGINVYNTDEMTLLGIADAKGDLEDAGIGHSLDLSRFVC